MTGAEVVLHLSERVAAGGDTIGHLPDGRVVFVEGALPGEEVVAAITEERRDFARARTVSILRGSDDRVAPPCPEVARGCGGCPWQHVGAGGQARLKELIVGDALRRIARLGELPPITTVGLPTTGYRTTVHLAVDPAGRPAYRRRHAHDTVAVDSCLVTHPALEELITAGRFPGHRSVTLRVGVAGGERVAVVDRRRGGRPVVPDGVRVVGPAGDAHFHEDAGGRRWRVSARAFFQAGPQAADAIAEVVDRALDGVVGAGTTVVDAYAGVGVLGGVVAARRGARLVAVEHHRGAVADARANLADLDARIVAADVGAWRAVPAEAVVADPTRAGLGRPGVAALVETGAARLVLVSCDPASLGRDTALLAEAGYSLIDVTLVDAFPHTFHVEVVSRFDRRPAAEMAPFPSPDTSTATGGGGPGGAPFRTASP